MKKDVLPPLNWELFKTPFDSIERNVRDQLAAMPDTTLWEHDAVGQKSATWRETVRPDRDRELGFKRRGVHGYGDRPGIIGR
jgi:hypothetical protein